MILNVLHDTFRADRYKLLMAEVSAQGLEIKLWEAVKGNRKSSMNVNAAHKQIVRYAKENNLPEICIAEDDIKFCGNGAWKYFLDNKPGDYDIYLGGITSGKILAGNVVERFSGFHLYMVHKKFYDIFLSVESSRDIDAAMTRKGRFIVCNPFAAITHKTFSDHRKVMENPLKYYRGKKLYGS